MTQHRHDCASQPSAAVRIIQQPEPRLILLIEQTCASADIALSRFGREAVKDPALVRGLRAGRKPRPQTRAAILAQIDRIRAGKAVRHA